MSDTNDTIVDSTTGEETQVPVTPAKNGQPIPAKKQITVGRFEGAFKLFAQTYYKDLKFYAFSPEVAHKVASDAVSVLGLAMSKDATLAAKISKANKNGEHKFKLSGSSAAVAGHNSMILVRLVQQLDALREEELLKADKPLKLADLMEHVHPEVQDYITGCEKWASEQVWETVKAK